LEKRAPSLIYLHTGDLTFKHEEPDFISEDIIEFERTRLLLSGFRWLIWSRSIKTTSTSLSHEFFENMFPPGFGLSSRTLGRTTRIS
jgi:hypothetical protein